MDLLFELLDALAQRSVLRQQPGDFRFQLGDPSISIIHDPINVTENPISGKRKCLTVTTRALFDINGRAIATFVGTNDAGATDSDPTGGGATGNNMVQTSASVYDNGGVGDGNLTQSTAYVDATGANNRVTGYGYDFRDRQISTTDATGRYSARQPGPGHDRGDVRQREHGPTACPR